MTLRSSRPTSAVRRGIGLIELLAIVAVLMIGLALMVSTARHVRSTSANELTRKRMLALATAVGGLAGRGVDPTLAMPVPATSTSAAPAELATDAATEARLERFAADSSRVLGERLATARKPAPNAPNIANAPIAGQLAGQLAGHLAAVAADLPELHDAWGRPIALLPGQVPAIGMAPDDGPFLISAGPDGRFLTLGDNIYSYDLPALLPRVRKAAGTFGTGASRE